MVVLLALVLLVAAADGRVIPPAVDPPSVTAPATEATQPAQGAAAATPSPPPTYTPSPTRPASATPTRTATATRTASPSPAPTSTPLPTSTPTPTPTPTPLLPTPDGVPRVARVPILMYHHIGSPSPAADAIRRDLTVSPSAFEEQLKYLKRQGYTSITLNDLALHLTTGKPLPEKPIILTFDDGYRDAYTHAFPLLRLYGYDATFFLVTAPIDARNPDWLTWEQVTEMHAAGMRFEPHSYDHPDLRNRSFDFLVFQILASQGAIEARTGETCRFFAYPSGRYDSFVIQVLRSANYWGGVLTEQGATHTTAGLFTLDRIRVQAGDDLGAFVRKLEYDW